MSERSMDAVDYNAAAAVPFRMVLERLELLDDLIQDMGDLVGACPLCSGAQSFRVDLKANFFSCTVCNASGNVLDFVIKYEDLDFIHIKGAAIWLVALSEHQEAEQETAEGGFQPLAQDVASYGHDWAKVSENHESLSSREQYLVDCASVEMANRILEILAKATNEMRKIAPRQVVDPTIGAFDV